MITQSKLAPLLIAVVAVAAAACTQTKTVEIEYTVEQTGLVPAPRGPHGAGPVLEAGEVSLEGSYVGATAFSSEKSRYEGATGNVVINHAAAARFAVGLGKAEIGFDAEMMSTKWGVSVPDDTNADNVDADVMFRLGPQARAYIVGDNAGGLGFLGSLSVASLPYHRAVYQKRYLTEWRYDGQPNWWEFPEGKRSLLGERTIDQHDVAWYFFFQAGLFGTIGITEDLFVQLGMMFQNQPEFFGTKVLSQTCTQYSNQTSSCSGDDPSDLPPTETEFLGTAFASISYRLGMLVLVGQVFGHPVASDYEMVEHTPFGGDFTVRLVF